MIGNPGLHSGARVYGLPRERQWLSSFLIQIPSNTTQIGTAITIVADRLLPHDAPVMSNEQDLCCALQMLRSIHSRANARDIAECIAQERAKAEVAS